MDLGGPDPGRIKRVMPGNGWKAGELARGVEQDCLSADALDLLKERGERPAFAAAGRPKYPAMPPQNLFGLKPGLAVGTCIQCAKVKRELVLCRKGVRNQLAEER